ncbi:MAG TPA: hypothetical protein VF223_16055 [Trebonia sp.]
MECTPARGRHSGRGGAFGGILIPFTGKTITQTEAEFQNLNRALKQRVESRD